MCEQQTHSELREGVWFDHLASYPTWQNKSDCECKLSGDDDMYSGVGRVR